jgi:hypothetical protein
VTTEATIETAPASPLTTASVSFEQMKTAGEKVRLCLDT